MEIGRPEFYFHFSPCDHIWQAASPLWTLVSNELEQMMPKIFYTFCDSKGLLENEISVVMDAHCFYVIRCQYRHLSLLLCSFYIFLPSYPFLVVY